MSSVVWIRSLPSSAPTGAHPGQLHRARSGEGARHAGRAVDTCHASRERGKATRARTKQPVSSELPPPTVRRGRGLVLVGALHIVCMCGEARPIEANVLSGSFHITHESHRSSEPLWDPAEHAERAE